MLCRRNVLVILTLILLLLVAVLFGADEPSAYTITVQPGESIQEAIDAAPEGAVICLADGEWVENLRIGKSLTLKGAGAERSVVNASQEGEAVIAIRVSGEGESVDIAIEGVLATGASESDGIFMGDSARATITSCTIEGNSFAIYMEGFARATIEDCVLERNERFGIDLRDSAQVTVTNCAIEETLHGISMNDSTRATITRCAIEGNEWDGIALEDSAQAIITDCTIGGNRIGISIQHSASATIGDNNIRNNEWGIFSDSDAPLQGFGNQMRENGVDLVGNLSTELRLPLVAETGEAQLSFPGPYGTLQETIDAVAPGGTITLAAGTYEGGLTVWKPLTLTGESGEALIVGAVSLIDEAQGVLINGIAIHSSGWGVVLRGRSQATITRCTIERGEGIEIGDGAQATIANCTVAEAWDGICIFGSTQATIVDCTIGWNGNHGIRMWGYAQATIIGCTIERNVNGINMGGAAQATIRNNEILGNRRYGMALSGWPCGALFGGYVQGSGNTIPGPDEPDGNEDGTVCPYQLSFLVTEEGGELDRRE